MASSSARRDPRPSNAHADSDGLAPAGSGARRFSYVLDTSVLLADPAAIGRFAEHRVVLPVVVITELEAKRHHPELGFFARQALRHLDPGHRAVVALHYLLGMPLPDVASSLHIPLGTAKSRLHYALAALRTTVTGDAETVPAVAGGQLA